VVRPVIPLLLSIPIGFFLYDIAGGGHFLIESLYLGGPAARPFYMLCLLLVVKVVFTAVCFGSGCSGGIFLPFLTMGALTGAIYYEGLGMLNLLPGPGLFDNFVILGMTGMFAAVVRAPITGILLLLEMCGNFTQFTALAIAAFSSFLFAELMGSAPVYTVLLDNIVKDRRLTSPIAKHNQRGIVLS
jgi:H+/Cl- antiporter ClcA